MSDFSRLPKVHERNVIVRSAERALVDAYNDVLERFPDLTSGEQIKILTSFLSSELGSLAKYMIREERHDSSDSPGGLAPPENGDCRVEVEK